MEKTELMDDAVVLQDNEEAVDNNEVLAQDMDFDENGTLDINSMLFSKSDTFLPRTL